MKKLVLLLSLALPALLNAQNRQATETVAATIKPVQNIEIADGERAFSKGTFASYQFTIPQAYLKDVSKDWQKYIKSGSKNKPVEANGETSMLGAVNKNVSGSTFDIYSTLVETTDGVRLTAWLVGPDSVYISKAVTTDRDLAAQKYLHDFAVQEYKDAVSRELKQQQDGLKALEDNLKEFIKEEEKSNQKIKENERSIDRQKNAITASLNDQKNKADQIGAQKKVVEQQKAISEDAAKDAAKVQKGYEKELKQLEKNHEKLSKEIDKWEADIREEGRNIEKSKQNQRLKNDSIEKQKLVIKAVEEKLAAIK
ncbi:MAG: hypothetical protein JST49_16745 [Bacteroidetes bacterium]|nr:hypothetical protein [Bacteroidota bacterium]